MTGEARRHGGRALHPGAIVSLDAQRPYRPTEVVAVADEVGGRVVDIPVFGEAVTLAGLPRVLAPIRTVSPLDEGGVDGAMIPLETGQQAGHQGEGTEDHGPHDVNDMSFLSRLAHRGIAQVARKKSLGFGRTSRAWPPGPRNLDRVRLLDRCLVGGVFVARVEKVGTAARTPVDLVHELLAVLRRSFSRHEAQKQTALGIHGGVIPIVTTMPVRRLLGIAMGLLLVDETPILIHLHGAGVRGKRRPTPRAAFVPARPPGEGTA